MLLTLGVFGYRAITAPPSVAAHVDRFAAVFQSADFEALMALTASHERGAARLREDFERRGWHRARPALGAPQDGPAGDTARIVFFHVAATPASEASVLELHFALDPSRSDWSIDNVVLPPIRGPEPHAAAEAFRSAWRADGIDALMQLCTEGLRRQRAGIERLFARRGWTLERPAITETAVGKVRVDAAVDLDFDTGDGVVETTWEYWHPDWRMRRLKPPEAR